MDIYERALKRLRADQRSTHVLQEVIGVPAETLRDIRKGIASNPRIKTVRKVVAHYYGKNGHRRAA